MWLAAAGASSAQTPPPDQAPTLGAVFKEVPRDLWKFVSWDTAIVVGAGGGAALVGHVWDDDLAHEVETSTPFNNAMEAGHTYCTSTTARVHDTKHYLSDVIFGGALGIAAREP